MENKNNFAGIIIPVIISVILLTVLPIINSTNVECPPCEEVPSYNIGNMEVNPDFSSGDYIVDKGSYDYIDSVTIIKDDNLIPENIKKDVNIFGVVGTLEESSSGVANGNIYLNVSGPASITVTIGDINVPYDYSGETNIIPLADYGTGIKVINVSMTGADTYKWNIVVVNPDGKIRDCVIYNSSTTLVTTFITTSTLIFISAVSTVSD